MRFFKSIAIICLLGCSAVLSAQVSNVHFQQDNANKKVIITYSLDQEADISLQVSTNGGHTFSDDLKEVTGDVGKNVKPGKNKRIVWDALKEVEEIWGNRIQFNVHAELSKKHQWFNKVLGQAYLEAGADFATGNVFGYSATLGWGMRMRRNAYLGVEFGYHSMFDALQYSYVGNNFTTDYWYVPIGLNLRIYAPMGSYKHSLVFIFSGGGYGGYGYYPDENVEVHFGQNVEVPPLPVLIEDHWHRVSHGYYFSAGMGFDLGCFTISGGYQGILGDVNAHTFYAKMGFRMGRHR